ncbi:MAG: glutamine-hydrolyzing GMP synthase [Terriglobia bacterium]
MARKIRELGVSSEVFAAETPLHKLRNARGIVISGGPASVYDSSSPTIQPDVLTAGIPVLGICYGQQLISHLLGGVVAAGDKGEFGLARLDLVSDDSRGVSQILDGVRDHQQVWMSHRDLVATAPPGFRVLATTSTCATGAIEDPVRRLYGVQFHPEVVQTTEGTRILRNFVFNICACTEDWNAGERVALIQDEIRARAGDRKIFFFVSGGVDSTVAFMLCLDALGSERVRGVYVDTGLMREGETDFVRQTFAGLGLVRIEDCADEFLSALEHAREPEAKRHIIGEQFVKVQERIIEERGLLDGGWILGQGTIYPDTIESGGTENAALIKTHHNRVPGIRKLMELGLIVEPLADFYKDEVRAIGRELGIAPQLLDRHPFPGPGLAIRCLCAEDSHPVERVAGGYLVPVLSVGVQGDSRSYAPVIAIDAFPSQAARLQDEATELVNRTSGVNRVIARVSTREPLERQRVFSSEITRGRLDLLREADYIVRDMCHESGFEKEIWQFPVVLIPVGCGESRDSVVLRPVQSVDGMTAESIAMPDELLHAMSGRLMAIPELAGVYYDLTHKPPGTIEWE